MKVIRKTRSMQNISDTHRREGSVIGLVPTMGALHDGHLSLIKRCKNDCDVTVVSIFINPLQFGAGEDLKKYPKQFLKDKRLADEKGVDYILAPNEKELYGEGFNSFVDVKGVTENLCGASRPGHFKGVTTVVAKLFNIVKPDRAYFGEKDYQQLVAIKKMVRDLDYDIDIRACKIVREKDGLALSSRNAYLSDSERKKAVIIYQSLKESKKLFKSGEKNALKIIDNAVGLIKSRGFRIDYVKIVDINTLKDIKRIDEKALMAVAVKAGTARLIDNIILKGN